MTTNLANFTLYDTVICADGARVSVQANRTMWCTPRNDVGPYTAVEAGLPSVTPPVSWAPFREACGPEIYAKLPVPILWEFFDAHGGVVAGDLPPGCERDGEFVHPCDYDEDDLPEPVPCSCSRGGNPSFCECREEQR